MIARITDDWLPLPAAVLQKLGWKDGDFLEIEFSGDTIIVYRAVSIQAPNPGAMGIRKPLPRS